MQLLYIIAKINKKFVVDSSVTFISIYLPGVSLPAWNAEESNLISLYCLVKIQILISKG
jgi:hypothetical protein